MEYRNRVFYFKIENTESFSEMSSEDTETALLLTQFGDKPCKIIGIML